MWKKDWKTFTPFSFPTFLSGWITLVFCTQKMRLAKNYVWPSNPDHVLGRPTLYRMHWPQGDFHKGRPHIFLEIWDETKITSKTKNIRNFRGRHHLANSLPPIIRSESKRLCVCQHFDPKCNINWDYKMFWSALKPKTKIIIIIFFLPSKPNVVVSQENGWV